MGVAVGVAHQPGVFHSPLYEMVKEGIDIKTIQWSQH